MKKNVLNLKKATTVATAAAIMGSNFAPMINVMASELVEEKVVAIEQEVQSPVYEAVAPAVVEEEVKVDAPAVVEEDVKVDAPVVAEEEVKVEAPVVVEEEVKVEAPVVVEEVKETEQVSQSRSNHQSNAHVFIETLDMTTDVRLTMLPDHQSEIADFFLTAVDGIDMNKHHITSQGSDILITNLDNWSGTLQNVSFEFEYRVWGSTNAYTGSLTIGELRMNISEDGNVVEPPVTEETPDTEITEEMQQIIDSIDHFVNFINERVDSGMLVEEDFTTQSWARLMDAVNAGQSLDGLDVDQLWELFVELQQAHAGLERVETDEEGGTTPPTQPEPEVPGTEEEDVTPPTQPEPEVPGTDEEDVTPPTQPEPEVPGTDEEEGTTPPTQPEPEVDGEDEDEDTTPQPELTPEQQLVQNIGTLAAHIQARIEAGGLTESDFTVESWTALMDALAAAQDLEGLDLGGLWLVFDGLQDAQNGLELVDGVVPTPPTQPEVPGTDGEETPETDVDSDNNDSDNNNSDNNDSDNNDSDNNDSDNNNSDNNDSDNNDSDNNDSDNNDSDNNDSRESNRDELPQAGQAGMIAPLFGTISLAIGALLKKRK